MNSSPNFVLFGHTRVRVPRTTTPEELGDTLARLVWESSSDFVADGDAEISLSV